MMINRDGFSWKLGLAALTAAVIAGCGCSGGDSGKKDENGPAAGGGATKKGPTWADMQEIPIGLVASENGDLKPWGDDSVKGAQMAVEEFNAAGGVDGKKVKLVIGDSASKPEIGKSAVEKLISNDKIFGVLGEVASGITAQMGQVATEKGIPLVAIGATKTTLTEGKPNMFRVCYTDAFQGPVMAKFAYEALKLRNVALVTDKKQPYSTGLSDSFRDYFTKLGGKIVGEEFYESQQTQFQSQLTNLKQLNPDGLFMSGYFNETGPLARQAKEAGLNVKMMGGDGWDSSEILNTGGDAILHSFFCNHYNNQENRPEVKDFLAKWAKKFNGAVPGTTMGALSYDATMVMLQALKNDKSKDSQGLQDAIESTDGFKGVTGVITLKGKHGNPPKRALVVELVKDPAIKNGQKFAKAYEFDEATGLPK